MSRKRQTKRLRKQNTHEVLSWVSCCPAIRNWPRFDSQRDAFPRHYFTALPDIHISIEDQVAEGDRVVTRWKAQGTNSGSLFGMPATNKPAIITGITIDRFSGGKIVETWTNFDNLGMLQQLGVIPVPRQGS